MRELMAEFKAFPPSVKKGFLFLVGGWCCNYLFFFLTITEGMPKNQLIQQLMLGFLCCYFLLKVKNWARVVCLMGNIVIIVTYSFQEILPIIVYYFSEEKLPFSTLSQYYLILLAGVIIAFFAASTYFLFQKEAAAYFKARNPQGDPAATGPDNNRSASS